MSSMTAIEIIGLIIAYSAALFIFLVCIILLFKDFNGYD